MSSTSIERRASRPRRRLAALGLALAAVASGAPLLLPNAPVGAQAAGSADLAVSVSHTPSSPLTGDEVSFTITASNAGPGTAADVVVGISLGYSWRYEAPEQGSCGAGGEQQAVICTVGAIAPGATASVTVEAIPMAPGVFVLPVAATSETPDPDAADRASTDTVIVRQGPTQAERLIGEIYRQVLGRSASPAETTFWGARWEASQWNDRYRVPLSIIASPESGRRRLQAAYQAMLGRPATATDLAFWSAELTRGRSFESFEVAVMGSPEFARRNGSDTGAVLQAVASLVLGRPATRPELGAWVAQVVEGRSVADVAAGLQRTTEARNRVIVRRVQEVLGRPAMDFDRFVWISDLNAGSTHDQQWARLFTNGELLSRFPYDYYYD